MPFTTSGVRSGNTTVASGHGSVARQTADASGVEGLLFPLVAVLLAAVLGWSALLAGWRGGVRWRGTLYPLADLRAGAVREADWPKARAAGWPVDGARGR